MRRVFEPRYLVVKYRWRNSTFNSWRDAEDRILIGSGELEGLTRSQPWTGERGGPFFLTKYEANHTVFTVDNARYQGQCIIGNLVGGNLGPTDLSQVSDATLITQGTTAIARSTPAASDFSFVQMLGELRKDGIPSMIGLQSWKHKTNAARAAGNEYLNAEFGWKPLVRDLKSFAQTVAKSDQLIQNYRMNSGLSQRVGYDYPSDTSTTYRGGNILPYKGHVGAPQGPGGATFERSKEVWFRGSFKYHVPISSSYSSKASEWLANASRLYGLRLTPELVWNLAPWSWAADWFANTGDVLHNVSALGNDGLVLEYGYMMSQIINRDTFSSALGSRTLLRKRCRRIPSTPYGFGTNLQTLSGKQIAILAALGLSQT